MDDKHPASLRIADFSYHLPDEKIAYHPLSERDASKLLIYRRGLITEDVYRNLDEHLPPESLLVLNDTRVVEARLIFTKPTGALVEVFLLEPELVERGLQQALESRGSAKWKCLIGGAGKWKHGQVMSRRKTFDGIELILNAHIVGKTAQNFTVEFDWLPNHLSFSQVLHQSGETPIPPYLKRASGAEDVLRYQTIFGVKEGSVAAPTAGLHFTDEILTSLKKKGIHTAYLTLHVGAGTFLPVKSDQMSGHQMHGEFIEFNTALLASLLQYPDKVFAVGTTSLRTLESIYWMGVKASMEPSITPGNIHIGQWEVYDELFKQQTSVAIALESLLEWMKRQQLESFTSRTEILIAPPYKPKMVKGLITNFHQPKSTLLLLVAAMIGDDWRNVYQYALDKNFRFLSYGDGCLLYVS